MKKCAGIHLAIACSLPPDPIRPPFSGAVGDGGSGGIGPIPRTNFPRAPAIHDLVLRVGQREAEFVSVIAHVQLGHFAGDRVPRRRLGFRSRPKTQASAHQS